jgi:hypothetical protein
LWCCKAALIPSRSRSDIVGLLWGLIVPSERGYFATQPDTFQTLAQGLFFLLPALSHPSTAADAQDDSKVLTDVIDKLCSGRCGDLDANAVQNEYNAVASPEDNADLLRATLFLDSLSKCLEQCTPNARLWLLKNSLEVWLFSYRRPVRPELSLFSKIGLDFRKTCTLRHCWQRFTLAR